MDSGDLSIERQAAGEAYLRALRGLGLDPEAAFWAEDLDIHEDVLVLVTSMFDSVGPYAVSQILFKAYNAAATPPELDPFYVRLHSPEHRVIQQLWGEMQKLQIDARDADGRPSKFIRIGYAAGGLSFDRAWIYKFDISRKRKTVDVLRQWHRFSRNVERLAA